MTAGVEYTFDVTPSDQGLVTINLAAGAVLDLAGNENTAADELSRIYDSLAPTVILTTPAGDPLNTLFTVTATFSEEIGGFTLDDVVIGNGTASNLQEVTPGVEYTFDVTPTADGLMTVNMAAGAALDLAGND